MLEMQKRRTLNDVFNLCIMSDKKLPNYLRSSYFNWKDLTFNIKQQESIQKLYFP